MKILKEKNCNKLDFNQPRGSYPDPEPNSTKSKEYNSQMSFLFTGFNKAFDSGLHDSMMEDFHKHGVSNKIT